MSAMVSMGEDMPKLDLGVGPMDNGVVFVVRREGEADLVVPMPLERAIPFWIDFWKSFGPSFPKESANPDRMNPMMFATGEFSYRTCIAGHLVGLWVRPADCSGIQFEFTAEQAREAARQLLDTADMVDRLSKPN